MIGNDLHKRKHEVVFVERTDGSRSTITREPAPNVNGDGGAQTPPLEVGSRELGGGGGAEEFKETWLRLDQVKERSTGQEEIEIESLIVERLVERHTKWINAGKKA